jgi:hypothetical protein
MMKRGHEHFWTEGAKIVNAPNVHPAIRAGDDPYYATARKTRIDLKECLELL